MLTISTFNCENLFSRPIVLNGDSEGRAAEKLRSIATLQEVLAKDTYSSDDKKLILDALVELQPLIEINQLRSALFIEEADGTRTVVARGRQSWVGNIELRREVFPTDQQRNTGLIVEAAKADIQCVVEVENRRVLEAFNAALANPYPYHVLIDGNDDRGIDVGLLSRFEIRAIHTHIFDKGGTVQGDRIFSRDCLEVELALPGGKSIYVLVNHLKSKRGANPGTDEGAPLRTIQAQRLAAIVANYDLTSQLVVVAGDFNDIPASDPLQPILSVPNLVSVVDRVPDAANRWTYHSTFGNSQIDYLLVSRPLANVLARVEIDRRGIFGIVPTNAAGEQVDALPNLSKVNQASDHASVTAALAL